MVLEEFHITAPILVNTFRCIGSYHLRCRHWETTIDSYEWNNMLRTSRDSREVEPTLWKWSARPLMFWRVLHLVSNFWWNWNSFHPRGGPKVSFIHVEVCSTWISTRDVAISSTVCVWGRSNDASGRRRCHHAGVYYPPQLAHSRCSHFHYCTCLRTKQWCIWPSPMPSCRGIYYPPQLAQSMMIFSLNLVCLSQRWDGDTYYYSLLLPTTSKMMNTMGSNGSCRASFMQLHANANDGTVTWTRPSWW